MLIETGLFIYETNNDKDMEHRPIILKKKGIEVLKFILFKDLGMQTPACSNQYMYILSNEPIELLQLNGGFF